MSMSRTPHSSHDIAIFSPEEFGLQSIILCRDMKSAGYGLYEGIYHIALNVIAYMPEKVRPRNLRNSSSTFLFASIELISTSATSACLSMILLNALAALSLTFLSLLLVRLEISDSVFSAELPSSRSTLASSFERKSEVILTQFE